MDPTRARSRRWGFTVLQAGALLALAVMSASFILWMRSELEAMVLRQIEGDLRDRIEAWEAGLTEKVVAAAEAAAADPSRAAALQARLRQEHRWFDSLYVWDPPELEVDGTLTAGAFAFPFVRPSEERLGIGRVPCIVQGRIVRSQPLLDRVQAADAMRRFCQDQPLPVRMVALTDAVDLLLDARLLGEAQAAIEADNLLPDEMSLHQAVSLGIPVYRAVVLRLEQADLLELMGELDEANDLRMLTGFEICALDAPDAQSVFRFLSFPIIEAQRRAGHEDRVARLSSAGAMAVRRMNAFLHVRDNLLLRALPADAHPRWVYDQHADNPFLLYTRGAQGGRKGAAVQADQDFLIEDFLEEMRSLRQHISITNADGSRQIAGVMTPGEAAFELPFATTLTHLRVELRQEAFTARIALLSNLVLLLFVPVVFMLVMGGASVWQQVRALGEQTELLRRQRDFATRVTHELKTPLAGIKVMAENLELGYFTDEDERASMAAAIVQEADRLSARVNEILAVTKERELRRPEPFDPEEPVLEAVEQWVPRMERAGVRFEADLHATDEVVGDAEAVRDAVACLLDNALKYRREDAESPSVWLTLTQQGSRVRIEVADNGLGVPAAERKAVFERFHRVEGPNRGKAGGHGLGLAQVQEIARMHGGRVRCDEGVDGGARFTLELPSR